RAGGGGRARGGWGGRPRRGGGTRRGAAPRPDVAGLVRCSQGDRWRLFDGRRRAPTVARERLHARPSPGSGPADRAPPPISIERSPDGRLTIRAADQGARPTKRSRAPTTASTGGRSAIASRSDSAATRRP